MTDQMAEPRAGTGEQDAEAAAGDLTDAIAFVGEAAADAVIEARQSGKKKDHAWADGVEASWATLQKELARLRSSCEVPTVDLDEALKRVDVSGLFDDPPSVSSEVPRSTTEQEGQNLIEKIEEAIHVAAQLGAMAFDFTEGRGLHQTRREIAAEVERLARLRSSCERPEAERLLAAVRAQCRVVYYPPEVGTYPIEHAPLANKDMWDAIVWALRDRSQDPPCQPSFADSSRSDTETKNDG